MDAAVSLKPIHWRRGPTYNRVVCGLNYYVNDVEYTDDLDQVTCAYCGPYVYLERVARGEKP